ncbi:MAG TPA: class I SAM-dependent methyltransferase [Acidimicrobiales bacterium]|nr:class I SAM-dependent methyltransferase [Acidimicrobiales bacterium]
MAGPDSYRPAEYWRDRLTQNFNLRGVGHLAYSVSYNRWLYRAKARALRQAVKAVPRAAPALDLGSGTGWVLEQLIGLGFSPEGCDLDQELVDRLAPLLSRPMPLFACHLGREAVPRPDATYGLVTMLDVAYHITDDTEWRYAVAEITRVLAPGGVLVCSDGFGPATVQEAGHVRFRSLGQWQAAAGEAGLAVETVQPYFRWLSRPRGGPLARVPGFVRGPVEYALERTVPRPPYLRYAVLRRRSASR